jgi:ABC-type polysaccharide/polyol phosphate transport system ATPase subunit
VIDALVFEDVSKHFRGGRSYRALRDDLVGAAARFVGLRREPEQVVRALDGVSFEIPEGQSFALLGPNGAGKTTALKLASRITYPTRGRIRVRGRVGALIEVGTGMHPELTGRENVDLYGRILGLSRRDVRRRFEEIVEFADVGGALEQPVKQFSSGMQLRLGFALAAHLEPDVLLVDEAIAVGDAGFQYRCVERMAELVREGRTLVFVSHNMSAIESLCERAVLLDHGRIVDDGPARDVVRAYLRRVEAELMAEDEARQLTARGALEILGVTLHDEAGREVDEVLAGHPMTVRLRFRTSHSIEGPIFEVGLNDGRIGPFALASMLIDGQAPSAISGEGYVDCTFDDLPLLPRVYELWGGVRGSAGFGDLVDWQRLRFFRVAGEVDGGGPAAVSHSLDNAPVRLPYRWDFGGGVTQ